MLFNLGECSTTLDHSQSAGYRFGHRGRAACLKEIFQKLMWINPAWWKSVEEKYFNMYVVPIISWASFATINFRGNVALWLQTYEAMHNVDKGDN